MAKEYDVETLESKSQEDLIALEDELVADDAVETVEPVVTPEPIVEPEKVDPEPVKAEEVKTEPDAAEEVKSGLPAADEVVVNEEEKQHVSPPSKWAEQRREKRELTERAEKAEQAAAGATANNKELDDLKAEIAWMKTAITSKGVVLPASPLETFNPEKIEEVRTEFGDELADMLSAASVLLQQNVDKGKAVVTPEPEEIAKTEEPAKTQEQVDDEQAMWDAVQGNDDMSYWMEKANDKTNPSTLLWDRARAKDEELSKDPAIARLSYPERFAKVVEAVKADVMAGATPPVKKTEETGPGTDMGRGGVVSSTTPNTAYDKVMGASDDPELQAKVYNSLSQADKDIVDKQLNI